VRIPIKATARELINRPDTYQRLPQIHAPTLLRNAAGPYIWVTSLRKMKPIDLPATKTAIY